MIKSNNSYKDYIIESKVSITVLKLSDMILEDDLIMDENNIIDIALEILDLCDQDGKKIFKLDENYHFDSDSITIFEKACEKFIDECELCSDLITKENQEKMNKVIELLRSTIKNKKVIKSDKKVRFITMPNDDYKSILESDIEGFGPHKYKFKLSEPSEVNGQSNAAVLLKELEQIEKVLSSDACIVKHTGQHQPFQSEGGIQVKRNVAASIRIPIIQYGPDTVLIAGIFHKEGQNDLIVQNEYEARKKKTDFMKDDINIDRSQCEKLYYAFKTKLIKSLYGNKVDNMNTLYRYMLEETNKEIVREDSYGR